MNQLMIDLETLATTPNAVITEIGAVPFDIETGETGTPLHIRLDPWEQIAEGRAVCPATIRWHINQKTDLRGTAGMEYSRDLRRSLVRLSTLTQAAKEIWIWGADFDRPILENAFRQYTVESLFWAHWQTRDARTLWKSVFREQKPAPRHHDALADALAAIADLHEAWPHIAAQNA
jgi:hypothetical protein